MSDLPLKQCVRCGGLKPVLSEHWYFFKGKPKGPCKPCKKHYCLEYAELNQEANRLRRKKYYCKNRTNIRVQQKQWYDANKQDVCSKKKRWRIENPGKSAEQQRVRRKANPGLFAEYDRRRLSTLEGRINRRAISAISTSLAKRGIRKNKPRRLIVGWDVSQLMSHLSPLFEEGMTWDNYGEWHIDHIIPLSAVSYESENDPLFKLVWSLSNLAPLWAKDNLEKNANIHWQLPINYKNPKLRELYEDRDYALAVFG